MADGRERHACVFARSGRPDRWYVSGAFTLVRALSIAITDGGCRSTATYRSSCWFPDEMAVVSQPSICAPAGNL